MPKTATPMWWISWEQRRQPELKLDPRPVNWPPPPEVLAFWISGIRVDGNVAMVVALMQVTTEEDAKRIITEAWSPGVGEWRFCRTYDPSKPPGERFPVPDWSAALGRWPWEAA